ncbi:SDR family NAD(P)-dependent oxidoreductase [Rhabdothermincola sediminis]|uniref:SDR family NAD(P)-dependent oxidoreductase n=1 Tax=Rhabdothermincola sediminis TaxID=2751370 RepID=UPI001AA02B88|nr:SDR family oxidoreductase [Rhabdothermincola sediminis]
MSARGGRLAGEIALVTGATGDIGRAIATRFATEGAIVAVTGCDAARGAGLVEEITAAGGTAVYRAADLSIEGECADLVAWVVEELGGLTVLVNNAATSATSDAAVHDLDTAAWDAILRVDLSAAMWLCRAAIGPMLDAQHGAIVNISPSAAARGSPGHAASLAAKGGLNALTRSIALDYAAERIRANSISPGHIVPDDHDRDPIPRSPGELEAMPATRLGRPDDIAHAALYLASKEAAFVTGIDLPVDGGSTVTRAGSFARG